MYSNDITELVIVSDRLFTYDCRLNGETVGAALTQLAGDELIDEVRYRQLLEGPGDVPLPGEPIPENEGDTPPAVRVNWSERFPPIDEQIRRTALILSAHGIDSCTVCGQAHRTTQCPQIGTSLLRPAGRSPQALIAAIIPTITYDNGALDAAWHNADRIASEARTLQRLLLALLLKINSVLSADLYQRVDRLHERALQRAKRRELAASIALYRYTGNTPDPDHPHYDAIMAALPHPCPACGDTTAGASLCCACTEAREVAVSEDAFYVDHFVQVA